MTSALSRAANEAEANSHLKSICVPIETKEGILKEITELHEQIYGHDETPTQPTNSGITSLTEIRTGEIIAITLYYDGILTITTGKIINGEVKVTVRSYTPDRKYMKTDAEDVIPAHQTPLEFIRAFLG